LPDALQDMQLPGHAVPQQTPSTQNVLWQRAQVPEFLQFAAGSHAAPVTLDAAQVPADVQYEPVTH
jgi:hypothetical protein